ncbi:MAG TPA: hypothetical protein PLK34_02915 [Candidatus Pacearchaeota archaeon]|nr:hypothetical protein [Candidatus Pacearchaeota archaeon]
MAIGAFAGAKTKRFCSIFAQTAEIEEAARLLQSSHFSPEKYLLQQQQAQSQPATNLLKTSTKPVTPQAVKAVHKEQAQLVKANPITPKKINPANSLSGGVSEYKAQKKSKGLNIKWLIIGLVSLLLVLLGAIIYLFVVRKIISG